MPSPTESQPQAEAREAREALITRIRKLSKMTIAAGCSEAEAGVALSMLQRLMEAHQITQDEVSIKADAQGCITDEFLVMNERLDEWGRCVSEIARLYGTRCWFTKRVENDPLGLGLGPSTIIAVKFFGLALDVAASLSMSAIIYNAVAVGTEQAKGLRGRNAKVSFALGMADRINARLRGMAPKYTPTAGTGQSLVVLKDSLVRQEFEALGLRLRPQRSAAVRVNLAAFAKGQSAGAVTDLGGAKVSGGRRALA